MIELIGLKKSFGTKHVTKDLSLKINTGEFLAIIGRSGEGKSVLLKQIIGLIEPDSGKIIINGMDLMSLKGKGREKIFKECGYVFQFAALLDSITIFENIALYHLEHGISAKEIKPLVIEKIKSVGLSTDVLDKHPDELSGGMKKRVGLARTLMMTPKILIYDEPTTGLDPITTRLIHELMLETHKKFNTTTIVISHDVEVFKYATHVAMLHEGKIIYKGETHSIWEEQNPYIYQFIRGLAEGPIQNAT
ncbi:ATP-binding cassette domain-containing protein [Candidatus Dependentiae bacterium]|nr:ATP-binding cassette domain-containing protein [Candidatus Dependentiae bacterium]